MVEKVTASLLIIGDEILSGRTQDKNLSYLATWLNEIGIQLIESRVVLDVVEDIADALNALRARTDYVFTTGGIGPTHDDITVDSIAHAFGVPVVVHPEADALLRGYYKDGDYTPARQRMARVPEGARLIDNPVSIAPGIAIDNVFIMAGVPKIMQAMLEGIRPHLKGGATVLSKALTVRAPESRMADALRIIQENHTDVAIGSYPFFKDGLGGAQIVIRSTNMAAIDAAMEEVKAAAGALEFDYDEIIPREKPQS